MSDGSDFAATAESLTKYSPLLLAFATLLLALATYVLARAARETGRTAELQRRHALFEERFHVYRLAKDALILAMQTVDYPYEKIDRDLTLAIDRGRFLFTDDKIEILISWRSRLIRLRTICQVLEDPACENRQSLVEEQYAIAAQAEIAARSLHETFFPEMDLRPNVEV